MKAKTDLRPIFRRLSKTFFALGFVFMAIGIILMFPLTVLPIAIIAIILTLAKIRGDSRQFLKNCRRALGHPAIFFIGMIEALSIWGVLNGISLQAMLLLDFFFISFGVMMIRKASRYQKYRVGDC